MRTYNRSYKLVPISKFIKKDCVADLKGTTKSEILAEMVDLLCKSTGGVVDPQEVLKAILAREAKISTGVGVGIAIPHARLESVNEFVIGIGRCNQGVPFDAFDEGLVYLVFMILSPLQEYGRYLNVHAKIALLMSNEEFRNKLLLAKDGAEMHRLMRGK